MRLGIGSYTYGWAVGTDGERPADPMGAPELIERARRFGVRVVQLCDNLPAETYEPASVAAIRRAADSAGIQVELGTRGCAPDHLRGMLGVARQLGSPVLRLVPDAPGDEPDVDEVVRRLRDVAPHIAGVVIAIENHDRFKTTALLEIIRRVESRRLGICLDTVNSFGALEGPQVVVERLGPHVASLHLKDFAVRRVPHLQGFVVEGRPLGQGRLDVPWLLGRLAAFGRSPNAIVEHWVPPEATLEQTIAKEADWARQSVAAARQWIKD
jgi:3-oxoisoapionate decarboxylase